MTSAPSIEREAKFDTDTGFALPDLRHLAGRTLRLPDQQLQATYVDTPDLRLWQRGITLRHRTGEVAASGVWTLKLPEPGDGTATLDRSEHTWAGDRATVPPGARAIVKGLVRHAALEPVVELVTTRVRLSLTADDSTPLAEVDDDLVTVVGGPRDGQRFRQVEVELDGEDRSVLEAVVGEFRRAGVRPGGAPKLALALGLPPGRSGRAVDGLDRRSRLADVVRASITDGLDRLLDHDYRLRLGVDAMGVHDVHQARVATRRLRSDLRTLRPALDPIWVGRTRDELKWVADALGAVRDCDVLAPRIAGDGSDHEEPQASGRRGLGDRLATERAEAVVRLAVVIDSDRYLALVDRLEEAARRPPFVVGSSTGASRSRFPGPEDRAVDVLPDLVQARWRTLRRRVDRLDPVPTDRGLHQVRIRAKQLRYAADLAAPVVGRPAARTATRAEKLQTVLGEHHDAVAAADWRYRTGPACSPSAGFTAGWLAAHAQGEQERRRRRWGKAWGRLDRTKQRAWLAGR